MGPRVANRGTGEISTMTLAFVQNLSLWQILLVGLMGLTAFGLPVLGILLVVRLVVRAKKNRPEETQNHSGSPGRP